jgi:hypothetical protein
VNKEASFTKIQSNTGMINIRYSLLKVILLTALTVLAVLHSGNVTGQSLESRYEQSLLDSLINFEMLKPRYFTLTKVNAHLVAENVELQMQNRLLSFQCEQRKRFFAQQLKEVRRKRRRDILIVGTVVVGRILIKVIQ